MARPTNESRVQPAPPVHEGPFPSNIADLAAVYHSEGEAALPPALVTTVLAYEWQQVLSSFVYFFTHYAMLKVKGRGEGSGWLRFMPFGKPRRDETTGRSWEWQVQLARIMEKAVVPLLVLKARQIGLTYIVCALCVWFCMTSDDQEVVIIANKLPTARKLVKRCIRVYFELPEWMRLAMPSVSDAVSEFKFANGSTVVPESSRGDTGRSSSANLVIIDEAAFIDEFTEVWASAEAAADGGGRVIMVTTANGVDNLIYDFAMDGISGEVSDRIDAGGIDVPVYDGIDEKMFVFLPYSCDPARDEKWREAKMANYKRSLAHFRQEYPENVTEAFITSGLSYFDIHLLKENYEPVAETYRREAMVGNIVTVDSLRHIYRFKPDPEGYVTVFASVSELEARLRSRVPFVLAADSAGSDTWGDYHAADAVQLPLLRNATSDAEITPATQLISVHGHMPANDYAEILYRLGWMLGCALVIPEANGVGVSVIDSLRRLRYPRIYTREPTADRIRNMMGSSKGQQAYAYGFYSTGPSKNQVYGLLDHALRNFAIEVRNPDTVAEMMKIVHQGNGRIGAREPHHDDRADALALAVGNLHKAREWRGADIGSGHDPYDTDGIFDKILRDAGRKREGMIGMTRGGMWK